MLGQVGRWTHVRPGPTRRHSPLTGPEHSGSRQNVLGRNSTDASSEPRSEWRDCGSQFLEPGNPPLAECQIYQTFVEQHVQQRGDENRIRTGKKLEMNV